MAADDLQGVRQGRILDIVTPVGRLVVDIEEPLPGRLLGRAAAGDPGALEIRIVDHGKPAVEALQGEGDRVKGGESRQQQALPHQRLGRLARHLRLAQEREPARPCQRYGGFVCAVRPGEFRLVDHVHEQAGPARRLGHPHHAAPHGQRAGSQRLGQAGLGQRGLARKVACETRQLVGNGDQPRVDLLRQLLRVSLGQQRCRQALEQSARQSLGHQAEPRVLAVALLVRRDTRQQPARFAAQQMLRRRLLYPVLELDEEQIDGAPIDEPDAVRVVELDRQVAGAGHGRTGARGERGDRFIFRPGSHQPDMTSL